MPYLKAPFLNQVWLVPSKVMTMCCQTLAVMATSRFLFCAVCRPSHCRWRRRHCRRIARRRSRPSWRWCSRARVQDPRTPLVDNRHHGREDAVRINPELNRERRQQGEGGVGDTIGRAREDDVLAGAGGAAGAGEGGIAVTDGPGHMHDIVGLVIGIGGAEASFWNHVW